MLYEVKLLFKLEIFYYIYYEKFVIMFYVWTSSFIYGFYDAETNNKQAGCEPIGYGRH